MKHIATLGFVGHIPFAPGTFGTLCAFLLCMAVKPSSLHLAISIAVLTPLGIFSSGKAEQAFGQKDSGKIVIDEFVGFLVSVIAIPQTVPYLFAAFLGFRFFDIVKPFPVRKCERIFPGGSGVMADDIMAGIYTNICLQIWRILF